MNKPNQLIRSTRSTAAGRDGQLDRGQKHRVWLLGLIVASCGCAHTLENRHAFGSKPSKTHMLTAKDRQAEPTRSPAVARTGRISDQSVPAASAVAATRAGHTRATAAVAGRPGVVPVSYDEPLAEVPVESSIADSSGFNSGRAACGPCGANGSCNGSCNGTCNAASNGACAPEMSCGPMFGPVPQYWNDQEYIYDGGDRDPRVQVTEDWRVKGLDSQDTVAHYETIEGELCVSPSNRVPIYAPRFGAVRKSTAPILSAGAVGARGMLDPQGAVVKATNEPILNLAGPQGPRLRDAIAPIDSLRDRTRGVGAEKILPPVDLSSYQMALKQLQTRGPALRRDELVALIGEYMVNARTWVSPEGLSVAMSGVVAAQVRSAKDVQDVTLYETEPGKCSLRICKAASHSAASPGDIISFSIRFENLGSKPIGNLVILDSLVSRLEYIDGSQQCILSLASNKTPDKEKNPIKFSTAENEAGSTVLRWESDLPLETADSGVITFRCRVR